jgi:endoglucanase
MNEPTGLAHDRTTGVRRWQSASQAAVEAIRSTGDVKTVFVSGYGGASPSQWLRYHPRAWITDPVGQVRYEAHQYFDADRTGHYGRTYQEETRRARAAGFSTACSSRSTTSEQG